MSVLQSPKQGLRRDLRQTRGAEHLCADAFAVIAAQGSANEALQEKSSASLPHGILQQSHVSRSLFSSLGLFVLRARCTWCSSKPFSRSGSIESGLIVTD